MDALTIPRKSWLGGMNSGVYPGMLGEGQYAYGENVVNRGGIVQTRYGLKYMAGIIGEKAQGGCIFNPTGRDTRILLAVDGRIYVASAPFFDFSMIASLSFDPLADRVVFCECQQSVTRALDGTLKVIRDPKAMLMMQDGTSKAGWYDGSAAGHLNPDSPYFGTPIGLWMAWVGSRLFMSIGSRVVASDLGNPLAFSEDTYLAERSGFELRSECTGLIEAAEPFALLAFTETSTTNFRANILHRPDWQLTPDFQKEVIPGVGCVAGKSPINHYGMTWWMSRFGWVSLNGALYSLNNSELPSEDEEMGRSKHNLSAEQAGICSGKFENYLMVSVPCGSRHNEHTWVMDESPAEISNGGPRCWSSIWTGFRPVEWLSGKVNLADSSYVFCQDRTIKNATRIHLWKAFQEDREDNTGPISCQFETGILEWPNEVRFKFAEIEAAEILGRSRLKVFVGGTKGPWVQIMDATLNALKGSIGSPFNLIINSASVIEAYKPQGRTLHTQEFALSRTDQQAESPNILGTDKGFSLLFEWTGRMGVRSFSATVTPALEARKGRCHESEAEKLLAVNDRGETITAT